MPLSLKSRLAAVAAGTVGTVGAAAGPALRSPSRSRSTRTPP